MSLELPSPTSSESTTSVIARPKIDFLPGSLKLLIFFRIDFLGLLRLVRLILSSRRAPSKQASSVNLTDESVRFE